MDTTADSTTGDGVPEAAVDGAQQDQPSHDRPPREQPPEASLQDGPEIASGSGSREDDSPRGARAGELGTSNKHKLLDQEGDAAADYLEELLDIADLDGDIDIFVENGRASVAVLADKDDADGLRSLIGRDGEVLDALQELTRLAAQARTGERSRLLLDIAGWREDRRTAAAGIATEAIERVRSGGESVELEPMPAYQRKAVHDAVAEAGLRSESDGAEPARFVVIHPA